MKSSALIPSWRVARIACAALLVCAASGASAGLFDDDEARRAILDLRQRLDTTETKLTEEIRRANEDAAQVRRSLIDLQNQLEQSRADLAKLRGQNEQLARDVAEVQRKQVDAAQALDERVRKIEPARVTVDGMEFVVEVAEKREYDAAMAVFRKGDFAAAQTNYVDLLTRYPNTGYRPSALFWLGNAQYATRNYKEALINFRSLVAASPDHLRAPEALLAIANCQTELKDLKAARKTLEDLVAKYPASEAAAAAKDRLARLR
jgi:tol-pal system protein YbgF